MGRQKSITLTPPERSGLKRYFDHFRRMEAETPPLWQHENPEVRQVGLFFLLQADPRIRALPTPLYRDELLIPTLHAHGMPEGPREPWLDDLITSAAIGIQAADEFENPQPPMKRNRSGHPEADNLILVIVWAAYLDARMSGKCDTRNAAHEAVAKRLGPGISRRTIDRMVSRFTNERLFAAATCFSDLMKAFDNEQAHVASARKVARHGGMFRPTDHRHNPPSVGG